MEYVAFWRFPNLPITPYKKIYPDFYGETEQPHNDNILDTSIPFHHSQSLKKHIRAHFFKSSKMVVNSVENHANVP